MPYLLGRTRAAQEARGLNLTIPKLRYTLQTLQGVAPGTTSEESPVQVERLTAAVAHLEAARDALLAFAEDRPRTVERTEDDRTRAGRVADGRSRLEREIETDQFRATEQGL